MGAYDFGGYVEKALAQAKEREVNEKNYPHDFNNPNAFDYCNDCGKKLEDNPQHSAYVGQPDTYVGPYAGPLIKGWIKNFLDSTAWDGVPVRNEEFDPNDSWATTVNELRRLEAALG